MLIDTHSHIYSEEYNGEIDEVMSRSVANGVEKIVLPNIDSASIKRMLDLADRYPQMCFPLIGLHPTSVREDYTEELDMIKFWLGKRKFYGIGEIGIDLYWDDTYLDQQIEVFTEQLKMAKEFSMPVSIHIRDSFDQVYQILKEEKDERLSGVFHSFTGNAEQAQKVIALGFKIGVGGISTFKNAGIDKMVEQLALEHLILETDSPYLAPTPMRGKRNESSYLIYIRNKVAELLNASPQEVEEITTKNALELFKI